MKYDKDILHKNRNYNQASKQEITMGYYQTKETKYAKE